MMTNPNGHRTERVAARGIAKRWIARQQAGRFRHFLDIVEHRNARSLPGGEPLGLAGQRSHHAVQQRKPGAFGEFRQPSDDERSVDRRNVAAKRQAGSRWMMPAQFGPATTSERSAAR